MSVPGMLDVLGTAMETLAQPACVPLAAEHLPALQAGLLLLGTDFQAIREIFLPEDSLEQIVDAFAVHWPHTHADSTHHDLVDAGFQPGALISGNMRRRLLTRLSLGEFTRY